MARLAQCDTILPSAFAACCSLPTEQLLDGVEREDGTRGRLGEDDLKLCFTGMRVLTHAASAALVTALAPHNRNECKTGAACLGLKQELFSDHADATLYFPTDSPFKDWGTYMTDFWDSDDCRYCLLEVQERFRAEQRRMWAELPSVFDLTGKVGRRRNPETQCVRQHHSAQCVDTNNICRSRTSRETARLVE